MRLTIGPCPGSTLIGILNLLAEEHGLTAITVGGRRKGGIIINVDTAKVTIDLLDLLDLSADPPGATGRGQPEPSAGLTVPGGNADPPCDIPAENFPGDVTPAAPAAPPTNNAGRSGPRKWSDADKAAAVRLADRIGSAAAGRQLDTHPPMINRWRREGHGADPGTQPGTPPTSPVASHAGPPHSVDQGVPGVGHATSDDPYVCTCGDDFPTSRLWAQHRNSYPESQKKHHRLEDQPVATLVPTGLPAPANDIARARAAAYDATTDEAADR